MFFNIFANVKFDEIQKILCHAQSPHVEPVGSLTTGQFHGWVGQEHHRKAVGFRCNHGKMFPISGFICMCKDLGVLPSVVQNTKEPL